MPQLKIHVNGLFRIEGPGGEDLTPIGAKECALFALLLKSESGARTRAWLQSHLWSDRGPEQASSSLRQAVYKAKNTLGEFQSVLSSSRKSIGLDLSQVQIISNPDFEYLEGIDVQDEEFEYWLTTQRMNQTNVSSPEKRQTTSFKQSLAVPQYLTIKVEGLGPNSELSKWLGQLTSDMVARSVAENCDLIVSQLNELSTQTSTWQLNVQASDAKKNCYTLRLALLDTASQRVLWTESKSIEAWNGDVSQNEALIELVQQFSTSLMDLILNNADGTELLNRPDALCALGIKKLFSMKPEDVLKADQLFAEAYEQNPRGSYLAWRAQVRHVQFVERLRDDRQGLFEEANSFARQAFEKDPGNSSVLAILAANRLQIAGDVDSAMQYAIRALKRNFGNAIAWWSLSAAHLASDNPAKAYGAARLAVRLAHGSPLEFWTLSQLAGAAMSVKRLGEAKHTLKNVAFGRPNFRPPIRYLLALHATDEEWEDAMAAVGRLQELEPGFSLESFANDRDYPVSLLHRSVGLDRDKVLSLI